MAVHKIIHILLMAPHDSQEEAKSIDNAIEEWNRNNELDWNTTLRTSWWLFSSKSFSRRSILELDEAIAGREFQVGIAVFRKQAADTVGQHAKAIREVKKIYFENKPLAIYSGLGGEAFDENGGLIRDVSVDLDDAGQPRQPIDPLKASLFQPDLFQPLFLGELNRVFDHYGQLRRILAEDLPRLLSLAQVEHYKPPADQEDEDLGTMSQPFLDLDILAAADDAPSPQTAKSADASDAIVKYAAFRTHSATILPLIQSISLLIENQREAVRGSNQIDPEKREQIEASLRELETHLELARTKAEVGGVLESEEEVRDDQKHTESWLKSFQSALLENVKATFSAEAVAKATVPSAIVLSCGSLGAIIAGPMGFGAGSILGGIITGNLKPNALADKLKDGFDAGDP